MLLSYLSYRRNTEKLETGKGVSKSIVRTLAIIFLIEFVFSIAAIFYVFKNDMKPSSKTILVLLILTVPFFGVGYTIYEISRKQIEN